MVRSLYKPWPCPADRGSFTWEPTVSHGLDSNVINGTSGQLTAAWLDQTQLVRSARLQGSWPPQKSILHSIMVESQPLVLLNPSPPGHNGDHFADDIFICIFINEKFCILIKISLKFVPEGPTDNIPTLAWIMAWCWIGDKPLSEPMLTWSTDAYIRH